jgi:WD40 repeat protein
MVEKLKGHKDSVYSVAFTPDGKELVSGSLDKTLKLWDVSWLSVAGQTQCKMSLAGHKVRVVIIRFWKPEVGVC